MESTFVTFRKFNDPELARQLTDTLRENNIPYEVEDASLSFDPTFVNSELNKEFRIKLNQADFAKADQLLEEISRQQLDSLGSDYYLFEFTDEELIEILVKPDEWNHLDVLLAQQILKDKGKEFDKASLERMKTERFEELSKPETSQKTWLVIGYICAFLGGIIGIFIGWHLASHKKSLPNGERVYAYSSNDRKHGNIIFFIGLIMTILGLIFKVFIPK